MKPTTPQQFANCYGTFIADLVIMAKVVPSINTWLRTSLPEVQNTYKLNPALFAVYQASITSFPAKPTPPYNESRSDRYNNSLSLTFTAIAIDLKAALACAEVDPSSSDKIIKSFLLLERGLQTRVR